MAKKAEVTKVKQSNAHPRFRVWIAGTIGAIAIASLALHLGGESLVDIGNILGGLSTAIGVGFGWFGFLRESSRYQKQREMETYRALSDRYIDYLKVLVEHPELKTAETEWAHEGRVAAAGSAPAPGAAAPPDANAQVRQDMIVQMACSMMETAFYLYRDQSSEFRRSQWLGWVGYMRDWCKTKSFTVLWAHGIIDQYDRAFVEHMKVLYAEVSEQAANENRNAK